MMPLPTPAACAACAVVPSWRNALRWTTSGDDGGDDGLVVAVAWSGRERGKSKSGLSSMIFDREGALFKSSQVES